MNLGIFLLVAAFCAGVALLNAVAWRWLAPSRNAAGWLTALTSGLTIVAIWVGFYVWAVVSGIYGRGGEEPIWWVVAVVYTVPVVMSAYFGLIADSMLWEPHTHA